MSNTITADLHMQVMTCRVCGEQSETRSIFVAVGTDAVMTVQAAEAAAAAGGGTNLALDAAVVANIKQLIADAKAGDGVIQTDLKALGITL